MNQNPKIQCKKFKIEVEKNHHNRKKRIDQEQTKTNVYKFSLRSEAFTLLQSRLKNKLEC